MSRKGSDLKPRRGPRRGPRRNNLLLPACFGLLAILLMTAFRLGRRASRGLAGAEVEAWRELGDEELQE